MDFVDHDQMLKLIEEKWLKVMLCLTLLASSLLSSLPLDLCRCNVAGTVKMVCGYKTTSHHIAGHI